MVSEIGKHGSPGVRASWLSVGLREQKKNPSWERIHGFTSQWGSSVHESVKKLFIPADGRNGSRESFCSAVGSRGDGVSHPREEKFTAAWRVPLLGGNPFICWVGETIPSASGSSNGGRDRNQLELEGPCVLTQSPLLVRVGGLLLFTN